jgi:hypothetical protein
MKLRYALIALSMTYGPMCHATTATTQGTIALLRDSTALQPDGRLQGVFLFQLSVALANGCNWIWISVSDKSAQAVAVAAKASGAQVSVIYDNTIVAPWGETDICGALVIDTI